MSCSSPGSRATIPTRPARAQALRSLRALPHQACGDPRSMGRRRYALSDRWTSVRASSTPTKAEGEHVRSFQLALSRLAHKPERARFDIHRPGPLIDHPEKLAGLRGCLCRWHAGGRAVAAGRAGQAAMTSVSPPSPAMGGLPLPSRPLRDHAAVDRGVRPRRVATLAVTTTPKAWRAIANWPRHPSRSASRSGSILSSSRNER